MEASATLAKKSAEQLRPYHFRPGQSGNPNGRPRGTTMATLKQLARDNAEAAAKRLTKLIDSENEAIALQAVQFAFLYGYGKPMEGRDLAHLEAMAARHQEILVEPTAPEEVPPTLPEPAPSVLEASTPPSLTSEAPSEPAAQYVPPAASVVSDLKHPAPEAHGLRCLYRGKDGQCTDLAVDGAQWCAPHKAKLFSMVNQ